MFKGRRSTKLESRRKEVLLAIRSEQLSFETMVQRARIVGETPNNAVLTSVPERFKEFEQRANEAKSIDDVDGIIEDAEEQGN